MSETYERDNVTGTSSGQPDSPRERLWRLWCQGQDPDIDSFLARTGPLSTEELADVLRVDQRQRWHKGERVLAEAYLERYPALLAHPEASLDLIYQEYLLREGRGEGPRLEEYCERFPRHADRLVLQVGLHRALVTSGAPCASADVISVANMPTQKQGTEQELKPEEEKPFSVTTTAQRQSFIFVTKTSTSSKTLLPDRDCRVIPHL